MSDLTFRFLSDLYIPTVSRSNFTTLAVLISCKISQGFQVVWTLRTAENSRKSYQELGKYARKPKCMTIL